MSVWASAIEPFMHNLGFLWLWSSPFCGTAAVRLFGTKEQKAKYLPNLVSGKWGSALAFTEQQAGSDLGMATATAVKQADGSYRIHGIKPHVTVGDSDLFENLVLCVLARVKGDPANSDGLSVFIVPKYLVNPDGSLGQRNDYAITGVERKLGTRGCPTVSINFGEDGNCYGELLGAQRQAMGMALRILQDGDLANGLIASGIASSAYLHSLDHARNRVQGPSLAEAMNPDAPRVPIIFHPFVRRLLLWMKSHVEGMRALVYYTYLCLDKANSLSEPKEKEKWSGIRDILAPICRLYSAERGFRVTENAVQVHGRYGYFSDYPVQQFMRDITPLPFWELGGGVHLLLYVTQTMAAREGKNFVNLLMEMHKTTAEYEKIDDLRDLAQEVQFRTNLLSDMGQYFTDCFKNGNVLVPIANGTPLIRFMGDICIGWLLFWQAGIAGKKLAALCKEHHIDPQDLSARSEFVSKNKEAAFYDGKVNSARFFIKNVLPQVDGLATAIKNGDLSLMAMHAGSF